MNVPIIFRDRVIVKIGGDWHQCSPFLTWHAQFWMSPKDAIYLTRSSVTFQKLGAGWIVVPTVP